MSKIKIYELADKLGVERKELLSKAQEFGISAKSTSKSLSDAEVLKLE
ncbi:translation initiation factor 2, partial [Lactococcus lactis subsp. lactis]